MLPWFTPRYQHFAERLHAQRLHHALLLSGPQGIGKSDLAKALSALILCKQPAAASPCGQCQSCLLFAAQTHPDYYVLESEKQLGVDAIRTGISKLSGTAQMGHNKVLVIPAADTMTEAAANALLKTLEEPTDKTYLLLLTDKMQRLLPTILSRCEKHQLPLPDENTALAWLREQGADATPALLAAYGHAPLRVEAALSNDDKVDFREFTDEMANLMANKAEPHTLANRWQDHAGLIVGWCQQQAYQQYVRTRQKGDLDRYQACTDALKSLQHPGVNKSLILTGILLQQRSVS